MFNEKNIMNNEKDVDIKNLHDKKVPKILISGSKRDLIGLTEPVHMCSNCWNGKALC